LCNATNRKDNENSIFDESISVIDLTTIDSELEFDLDVDLKESSELPFVENVLIYISGFLMRTLIKNEPCTFCYTYLKECKDRVSCNLIESKQRGGLICPLIDAVNIVKIANRYNESSIKVEQGVQYA